MDDNLQPIVAVRQQLIRALTPITMQPMVVLSKQRCRELFSERLDEAFRAVVKDYPDKIGRAMFISKYVGGISRESARKWLEAESIPDMGHLATICTKLKIRVDWLFTGKGPMLISEQAAAPPNLPIPIKLIYSAYESMDEPQRATLVRAITFYIGEIKGQNTAIDTMQKKRSA